MWNVWFWLKAELESVQNEQFKQDIIYGSDMKCIIRLIKKYIIARN